MVKNAIPETKKSMAIPASERKTQILNWMQVGLQILVLVVATMQASGTLG
jgi:hypothetical protein